VKLAKKEAKPAAATATKKAEPKAEKKTTEKKTAEKKTTEKKAPAAKKATATVCVKLPSYYAILLTRFTEGEGQGYHHFQGCCSQEGLWTPQEGCYCRHCY